MKLLISLLKAAVIGTSLFALLSLSSCNTVLGLGRDIENTGNAIGNAAR